MHRGIGRSRAKRKEKEKEKEHEGKNVDSGSFGVFQNGHRVGTETFSIYQTSYRQRH